MLRLIVVLGTLVVIVVALIATKVLLVLPDAHALQEQAVVRVLRAADGDGAEAAYALTAARLRDGTTLDRFAGELEERRRVLGAFRALGTVHERVESGDDVDLVADVRYERGEVRGTFRVALEDDAWHLAEHDVRVPAVLRARADQAELESDARARLLHFGAGRFAELRDGFTAELRASWPEGRFGDEMRSLHERLGGVRTAELRSIDEACDGAVLLFDVVFERHAGSASFGYVQAADGWELSELSISQGA